MIGLREARMVLSNIRNKARGTLARSERKLRSYKEAPWQGPNALMAYRAEKDAAAVTSSLSDLNR
eukprot:159133-Hanusia_phi.AAC.1